MTTIKTAAIFWNRGISMRLIDSYINEMEKLKELGRDKHIQNDRVLLAVLDEQIARLNAEFKRVSADDLTEITEEDADRIERILKDEQYDAKYPEEIEAAKARFNSFYGSIKKALKEAA